MKGGRWRLGIHFTKNGTTSEDPVAARKIIKIRSDPFLVLFSHDKPDFQNDFERVVDNEVVRRQKRYIEISLNPEDVTQHPNDIPALDNNPPEEEDDTTKEIKKKRKKYTDAGLIPMPKGRRFEKFEVVDKVDKNIMVDYENDDLSKQELDKYKYEIQEEEGDLIPYPSWWKPRHDVVKKKKEKKTKRKKTKKRDKKKDKKLPIDKSKSLPNIWKSLGSPQVRNTSFIHKLI